MAFQSICCPLVLISLVSLVLSICFAYSSSHSISISYTHSHSNNCSSSQCSREWLVKVTIAALHCTALHYTASQGTGRHDSALPCCSALALSNVRQTSIAYSAHGMFQASDLTLLCSALLYCALLCITLFYSVLLCSAILNYTILSYMV